MDEMQRRAVRTSLCSGRFVPSVPASTGRGAVTGCGTVAGGGMAGRGVPRRDMARGQVGWGVLPDPGAGAGCGPGGLAALGSAGGLVPATDGWGGGLLLCQDRFKLRG